MSLHRSCCRSVSRILLSFCRSSWWYGLRRLSPLWLKPVCTSTTGPVLSAILFPAMSHCWVWLFFVRDEFCCEIAGLDVSSARHVLSFVSYGEGSFCGRSGDLFFESQGFADAPYLPATLCRSWLWGPSLDPPIMRTVGRLTGPLPGFTSFSFRPDWELDPL